MSIKKKILARVVLVYFAIMAVGALIIGKIIYTQWHDGPELRKMQQVKFTKNQTIKPQRGDILATDGRVLATSVPYYEIRMDTHPQGMTDEIFKENIDSLAICLARMPGKMNREAYKKLIVDGRRRKDGYLLIERRVDYLMLKSIKKYPLFRLGANKGGLIAEARDSRKLPYEGLAERTIGTLNEDPNVAIPGLEGAYDPFLKGKPGLQLVQRLYGGEYKPINSDDDINPVPGGDIVSTIDVNIQDVAEESLLKCLKQHAAHHGSVVVMEVATGDVKAIANLGRDKDNKGEYRERYNYALGEAVEPGSTFKLMSYMAAFEDGFVHLSDSVNNGNGEVRFYGKLVHDDHRKSTLGWLTVEQAFAQSSNVSVTKLIDKYYRKRQKQFIDRLYSMNLNRKLGVELEGEGEPLIKYPDSKDWSGLTLTQMAYGYEVLLAPIQTLAFYNAVANDGKMVKPRFVKELRRHGSIEEQKDVAVIKTSIAAAATIRNAKKMMEAVVDYGSAKDIKTDLYKIAGKTGTAQIANDKYGYGHNKQYYASFVGYFPADRPKYSCIVTIYAPDKSLGSTGGGKVAAPVFREIADKLYAADLDMAEPLKPVKRGKMADVPYAKAGYYDDLRYVWEELDIPFSNGRPSTAVVNVAGGVDKVTVTNRITNKSLVPNVVDMGLKDALYLLEKRGLQVSVLGRGRVVSQSLAPGTEAKKGRIITLEMSK